MTAPTPPPATGRDTGEACWARGADGEGNPNCSLTGDHDGPHSDQPPAPQAGASVEALDLVEFRRAISAAINFHSFDACCEMADFDMADAIVDTEIAASAPGGFRAALAQRDAAVRAEVGERIASAIEARRMDRPPLSLNGAYLDAADIARTTGGDR